MYEIQIESEEFKEKRTVQQHQMVNQVREEQCPSAPHPCPYIREGLPGGMVFDWQT